MRDRRLEPFDIALSQHPRRVRAKLCRVQASAANPFDDGGGVDLQYRGRFIKRQLAALMPLARSIHVDRMAVPKRADAARRPAFPVRGATTDAVQDGGDHRVRLQARQSANQFDDVRIGDEAMLSGSHFFEAQLRVVAATAPVEEHLYRASIRGYHDFREHRAQDALLPLRRALRMLPQTAQIGTQGEKSVSLLLADTSRALLAQCFELPLELRLRPQRHIPASLQLGGDESVRRIKCCRQHLMRYV